MPPVSRCIAPVGHEVTQAAGSQCLQYTGIEPLAYSASLSQGNGFELSLCALIRCFDSECLSIAHASRQFLHATQSSGSTTSLPKCVPLHEYCHQVFSIYRWSPA